MAGFTAVITQSANCRSLLNLWTTACDIRSVITSEIGRKTSVSADPRYLEFPLWLEQFLDGKFMLVRSLACPRVFGRLVQREVKNLKIGETLKQKQVFNRHPDGLRQRRPGAPSRKLSAGQRRPGAPWQKLSAGQRRPGAPWQKMSTGQRRPGAPSQKLSAGQRRPGAPWQKMRQSAGPWRPEAPRQRRPGAPSQKLSAGPAQEYAPRQTIVRTIAVLVWISKWPVRIQLLAMLSWCT